jgi:hypothetical protein
MKAIVVRIGLVSAWLALSAPLAAVPPPDPYQPLAFLVGHCWKGALPGGQQTDEHCFSWMYGGKFVRDEHVVRAGDGRSLQSGESIYVWDAASRQLQYLYVESSGGFSRGTVAAEQDGLVFPAASYIGEGGKALAVRSRWTRAGDDAYDILTEFQEKEGWVRGFSLHMQRVRNAPT